MHERFCRSIAAREATRNFGAANRGRRAANGGAVAASGCKGDSGECLENPRRLTLERNHCSPAEPEPVCTFAFGEDADVVGTGANAHTIRDSQVDAAADLEP